MLNHLQDIDTQLFYWINGHHAAWLDWPLWVASQSWSWAAVLILAFLFLTLRYERRTWGWLAIGIALCFLFSDRISVVCFKDVVCRLRPCHALENVRMFRTTCGGQYGFVSSHAANVFALAIFLAMRYWRAQRGGDGQAEKKCSVQFLFPILIMLWACVVGYSRPYLGKHYPGDVMCGALVGLGLGALVYFLTVKGERWMAKRKEKKENNSTNV